MRTRPFSRGFAAIAIAAVALFSGATPASAHVDLIETTPSDGSVVMESIDTITMKFSGDIDPEKLEVELLQRDGTPVVLTDKGEVVDGDTVVLHPPALDYGTYVLVWKSIDASGHVNAGQSSFSYKVVSGPPGEFASGDPIGVQVLSTISRFATFAAASVLLGLALIGRGVRRRNASIDADRFARIATLSATVLAAALLTRPLVAATGFSAIGMNFFDGLAQLFTTFPNAIGWILTLALVPIAFIARKSPAAQVAVAIGAATADVISGHLIRQQNAAIVIPLVAVHVLAVVVWVGSLVAWMLTRPEGGYRLLLRVFTPWAAAAALAVSVSGPALFLARTGSLGAIFEPGYGWTVLGKSVLVLAVIAPIALIHLVVHLSDRVRTLAASTGGTAAPADEAPAEPTERERNSRRRLLRIETVALLIVVLLGSSLAGMAPKPQSTGDISADLLRVASSWDECMQTSNEQTERFLCLQKFFNKIVEEKSAGDALAILNAKTDAQDNFALINCHELSHKIGRAAWVRYRDIPEAMMQGQDNCDFGYMHGIIEGFAANIPTDRLTSAIAEQCDALPLPQEDHQKAQCYHGVGHAIARRTNLDAMLSFDMCRYFDTAERTFAGRKQQFIDCGTGVIMEWTLANQAKEMTLPIGAPGTTLDLCLALDPIFHESCFEYVTSPLGGNIEKLTEVRDWCERDLADPTPCFRSIGRDAMWATAQSNVTEQQAIDMCYASKNPKAVDGCLLWALGSVVTIYHEIEPLDRVCQYLDPERQRTLCPSIREAMLQSLASNQRGEESVKVS